MRAVIQRVSRASVTVDGVQVSSIGKGLVALIAVEKDEPGRGPGAMAAKISSLRIFPDDAGRMNRSVLDVSGEILIVSQFTLYGDASKGNRPSFVRSASREAAEPMIEQVVGHLRAAGLKVVTGVFGAHMEVALVNDGPVTIQLEI